MILTIISFFIFLSTVAFAVAPTVGTIFAMDPITLSAGTTKQVWCNATVTDADGDFQQVNSTLWDSAATTETAANDGSNHYTNGNCTLSGSGTSRNANCSFSVQFYANPAEWTCKIYANDTAGNVGSNSTADVTVNQLKAISVTSSITFPEQALGSTTTNANEQTTIVTNAGNVLVDVSVYGYGASESDGYAMTCTVGTITIGNLRYNTTAAQDFSTNMTSLTSSAVTLTDFDLAKGASSTKNIYWKLQTPSTGVGGTCSGNIIVSAV